MANRVPPSLAWLIETRARIDGEMTKTRQSLGNLARLLTRLETAEARLRALDEEIAAHPLTREPKRAGAYFVEHHRRLPLPHGELTQCLLECLSTAKGAPVKRNDLLEFVFARYPQLGATDYYRKWIREVVKDRLNRLAVRHVVIRHHDRRTHEQGSWSLAVERTDE